MRSAFVQPSSGQKTLSGFETEPGNVGEEEEEGDFLERGLASDTRVEDPPRFGDASALFTFEERSSSYATFSATLLFECQTAEFSLRARWSFFGFARSFSTSPTGSPVDAFSTSPPSSIAISVSSRFDTTERGRVSAMSSPEAKSSRCLIRSHAGRFGEPQPFVRTRTHEPFSFSPSRVNVRSPFSRAAPTSGDSGAHVPRSHTMTVPPPYSPAGMIPSNAAYSSG